MTDIMSILSWGYLLMFPGILATQINFVLKAMELYLTESQPGEAFNRNNRTTKLKSILEQFTLLEYAVRRLRNCRLSAILLIYHFVIGSNQVCQSYIAFQGIKSGQPEYYLFLDTWSSCNSVTSIVTQDDLCKDLCQDPLYGQGCCQNGNCYCCLTATSCPSTLPLPSEVACKKKL
ncbi:unnamed protein product [Orchesella dallaii]|uniref:Uncharacterized protein n=1 Tax=Orchesella dallaii TaxID=48710 RepID=A0ABP1RGN8_9HEXA